MDYFLDNVIKNSNILLVDDEPVNLALLSEFLQFDGYKNISSYSNPMDAVTAYQEEDFDIVLLDIMMPGIDGFAVMEKFSEIEKTLPPPIIVLTAQTDINIRHEALKCGASDFLLKPFDDKEIKFRIRNILEMHFTQKALLNYNINLEKAVKSRTKKILNTQLEVVHRLGYAAEFRDTETADHTIRVGEYSRVLGEEVGLEGDALLHLYHAAPMHDIGKIGIRDDILLKPGTFTKEERKEMEKHTIIGAKILDSKANQLLIAAKQIAISHHERWDGDGYPYGLKGSHIPLNARIVMVADVFDALTMNRPYKQAWTIHDAVNFIVDNAGIMFDPNIVDSFMKRKDELIHIMQNKICV